jgi:hypothetical protein
VLPGNGSQQCPLLPLLNGFGTRWLATLAHLTHKSNSGRLVGRSVKLLVAFASTVVPVFSLLEIHDQDFHSLLDRYVFRNGTSSSTDEVSVFLWRRYVCCTVVSARVHPRCHGIQVTVDSVHPLTLHYITLSNIYARYTDISCQ